jgi:adenine-specific DNA-methyltransferase
MSSEPLILGFSPPRDEPRLAREEKRAKGVYYTPPEIVRWMVTRCLEVLNAPGPTTSSLRIFDPSCGAGGFLREAQHQIPDGTLMGVDIDPTAIATATRVLNPTPALTPLQLLPADFLSSSFSPPPFDLILGNPPYVNIRELAKSTSPAYRQELRQRFKSACGNFDLYVLFLERSLELLKPGGVCGMIIPNKWSGLDYARPLRELLLAETTLHDIVDLSGVSVFAEAEVYPQILIFQKTCPTKSHAVRVREIHSAAELCRGQSPVRMMPQALLSPKSISLHQTLDVESRVPTEPLGQRTRLHSGASGYTAGHMAELLQEADEETSSEKRRHPFIVSGNIDRYSIRLGNLRYMHRKFRQPLLDLNSDSLSPLKKKLYANPKIVIAGMSRRIEAAYDEQGLALGVQVYAAAEPLDDPYFLLALLNSRLMSFLFRERFPAKKLAGGYLAMNKGQLEQLPIRVVDNADQGDSILAERIAERASWGRLPACREFRSGQAGSLPHDVDREIDELVYQLYRLTTAEIRQVDAAFEERQAKAA